MHDITSLSKTLNVNWSLRSAHREVSQLEAPSPAGGSWAGAAWLGGTMLVDGGGEGGGAGARPGPGLVHSVTA